jgi:hypothetical protein
VSAPSTDARDAIGRGLRPGPHGELREALLLRTAASNRSRAGVPAAPHGELREALLLRTATSNRSRVLPWCPSAPALVNRATHVPSRQRLPTVALVVKRIQPMLAGRCQPLPTLPAPAWGYRSGRSDALEPPLHTRRSARRAARLLFFEPRPTRFPAQAVAAPGRCSVGPPETRPCRVSARADRRRRAAYLLFLRSRRIASSASMISSRLARLLLKLSFRLKAFVGALNANT